MKTYDNEIDAMIEKLSVVDDGKHLSVEDAHLIAKKLYDLFENLEHFEATHYDSQIGGCD
jgi:hypothetical protein